MNFYQERAIIDFVNFKTTVSVRELAEKFQLSERTIRRVLSRLEEQRNLVRYFGGVRSISNPRFLSSIAERLKVEEEAKDKIARRASLLIKPQSTIILFGGTTIFKLCKYIKKMDLTLVTNSIIVFSELKQYSNIKLVLLGGVYTEGEGELFGEVTLDAIKKIRTDYMFLGTDGYRQGKGFFTNGLYSRDVYRWGLANTGNAIVLADSTKFSLPGEHLTASPREINYLISDSRLSEEISREMAENKVKVFLVSVANSARE